MEGSIQVALAAIGLTATTVAALIYVLKYFIQEFSKDIREHTKAAQEQTKASREQTKSNKEVLTFMKNLNGKLEGAVISKAKENK